MNIFNLLGQRAVTSYYGGMNSVFFPSPLIPASTLTSACGAPSGYLCDASSYQVYESGYNVQQAVNDTSQGQPQTTLSSQYGKPYTYQLGRSMRFGVTYTF